MKRKKFIKKSTVLTPIVDLPSGPVQGVVTEYEGTPVYKFLGIPYAKPPIDTLRLQPPEALDPWTEVKLATEFGPACQQTFHRIAPEDVSEDCLYLNIYVSEPTFNSSKTTLRPVLFWIHGGAFKIGAGNLMNDESPLVPLHNVILVSINYRLNSFGFMYFGHDEPRIPQNIGLKDQLFALKWVHENIIKFGGDPDLITIFGESAGGMSVSALLLSPLTKGLFKRAIIESGTVYTQCGDRNRLIEASWELYNKTSCATQQKDILTCMQSLKPSELLENQNKDTMSFLYAPGDDLLPNEPCEAIAEGLYDSTPELIVGVEKNEASLFMTILDKKHFNILDTEPLTYEDALRILSLIFDDQSVDHARELYFGAETNNSDYFRDQLEKAYSDVLFVCPTYIYGHQYATTKDNSGKVYAYYHTQRPSSFMPVGEWMGTHHAAELPFVFGHPFINSGYTEKDVSLSREMMKIWAHFAEKGEPPQIGETRWAPLQEDSSAMILNIDDWGKTDSERIQFCLKHWPFILQHRMKSF
ncbi:acetylcholinesterase isoform X2 [Tetranychus urticae]|uniref:acetylcholinesterase isoform X2 n=1 Tax=Tetranychus urticae TaxID=32264 RepID=UPI00077BA4B8|nr:acetylcholinesterase isoform X2 [Tetranychus urticae]XP_015792738.1 acetylcholinesterase isoform X2 [Tetranychus urticae]